MMLPKANKTKLAASLAYLWLAMVAVNLLKPLDGSSMEYVPLVEPTFPIDPEYNQSELAGLSQIITSKYLHFTLEDKYNALISPVCIHSMLVMLMKATKPDGSMRSTMMKELSYDGAYNPDAFSSFYHYIYAYNHRLLDNGKKPKDFEALGIDMISKIFLSGNQEINPEFNEEMTKQYLTLIEPITTVASFYVNQINHWARSRGFKDNIIDEKNIPRKNKGDVSFFSGLAIRSIWEKQFDQSVSSDFFNNWNPKSNAYEKAKKIAVLKSSNHMAQFMKYSINFEDNVSKSVPNDSEDFEFIGLRIPMKGHRETMMTIFVPKFSDDDKPKKTLDWLVSNNDAERFVQIYDELCRSAQIEVDIEMPKFRFEKQVRTKSFVKSLGMGDLYTNKSELTRLTVQEPERIKYQILLGDTGHNVFIQVQNTGAKSGAISRSIAIGRRCKITSAKHSCPVSTEAPSPTAVPKAIVDNPFLFYLTHDNIIMLAGRMIKIVPG